MDFRLRGVASQILDTALAVRRAESNPPLFLASLPICLPWRYGAQLPGAPDRDVRGHTTRPRASPGVGGRGSGTRGGSGRGRRRGQVDRLRDSPQTPGVAMKSKVVEDADV